MNIRLRPLEDSDAYISVNWRNDPEIWKLTGNKPDMLISVENEISWIQRVKNNKCELRLAIIFNEKYIGNIYLTDISYFAGQYHIFIGEKQNWGRNIAYKASIQLISYAKSTLGLKQIYLFVRHEHFKAIKLYTRLGFYSVENKLGFIKMKLDL